MYTVRDVTKGPLMGVHTLDLRPAIAEGRMLIHKLPLFLRHLRGPGQNVLCVYAPSFPLSNRARTTAQRGLQGAFALNGL